MQVHVSCGVGVMMMMVVMVVVVVVVVVVVMMRCWRCCFSTLALQMKHGHDARPQWAWDQVC